MHPHGQQPGQQTSEENRTVGKELGRYNVDIALLSETRLAEEGQLNERGAGYTSSGVGKGAKNLIDYIIVRRRDRQDV